MKNTNEMNDTKNSWEDRQTADRFAEKLDKATDCDKNKRR